MIAGEECSNRADEEPAQCPAGPAQTGTKNDVNELSADVGGEPGANEEPL